MDIKSTIILGLLRQSKRFGFKDISSETLRNWLFIWLGIAIIWGVDAVIQSNWVAVIAIVLFMILILFVMSAIENAKEKKQQKRDAEFWRKMKRTMKKAVKEGVKDAISK